MSECGGGALIPIHPLRLISLDTVVFEKYQGES